MFFLSAREGQKLKTFSGTSRAGKHTLKIEIEYGSALDMAMDIENLEQVAEAQKPEPKTHRTSARPVGKTKQISRIKRLELPAPGDET